MFISIIIPTFNRNEILCRTLSNIIQYKHQFNELIIIDQTKLHEPDTTVFLNDLKEKEYIKYIYINSANLPNARNIGIENSSGDIIIFFDDDIEINEHTIPSHISAFNNNETGGVTGKVTIVNINNKKKIKDYIKFFLFYFLKKKASYICFFGILSDFTKNKILKSDTCIGCNMSFRKETVIKCGAFDSNYTGNAYREDTDISMRIRKEGYKIMYVPQASVIHYMTDTGGTRTEPDDNYFYTLFKNQCYFYLKNFNYSYIHILLIHSFDIIRCIKIKLNAISLFKNGYNDARSLKYKSNV